MRGAGWLILAWLAAACDVPVPSEAQVGVSRAALCEAPDGGPPDAGPPPLSKTERLFDDSAPPRLFRITVAPDDLAFLDEDPRREQWVPAQVELEGERFEHAALRYKGAYGSLFACVDDEGNRTCPKLSLKVSFNEYVDGGRFMGVRKLVFNSAVRDHSYLHERLAYALFRAAGITASRVVHARVSINDGPESLFVLVENIDKEWVEDRFERDDGNIYKQVWPQHTEPGPYLGALRTNQDRPDVSRMVDFARLLATLEPETFNDAVDPWIDREVMARYFVVDQVTQNWDGIWKFYCGRHGCGNHNFYIYDDPGSGRLVVLPWDLDFTFGSPNDDMARSWWVDDAEACESPGRIRPPQCDPLLRGLMRANWALYKQTLLELTRPGAPLSEAEMLARLDRYRADILPHVEGDPQGPDGPTWRREVGRLRQVVRAQAAHVRRFLEE